MSRELVTDELWTLIESLLTLQMTVRMFRDTTARPHGNRSLLVASTQPFVHAPPRTVRDWCVSAGPWSGPTAGSRAYVVCESAMTATQPSSTRGSITPPQQSAFESSIRTLER